MATIICKRCNEKCCTCSGCKIVGDYCKPCADIIEEEKQKQKDVVNKDK